MNKQVDSSAQSNLLVLTAQLIEKSPVRYTPAGIPVCEIKLAHHGEQVEAGVPRQVRCEIEATGIGAIAHSLDKLELGQYLECSGFLAQRSLRTQRLQFHLNQVEVKV